MIKLSSDIFIHKIGVCETLYSAQYCAVKTGQAKAMLLLLSLLCILWRTQACTDYGNLGLSQELIQSLLYSKPRIQTRPTSAIGASVTNVVVVWVETRQRKCKQAAFYLITLTIQSVICPLLN